MDRAAWRGAIHGALLEGGRPTRAAAAATNQRIKIALADARAGVWDLGAAAATSVARAALLPAGLSL